MKKAALMVIKLQPAGCVNTDQPRVSSAFGEESQGQVHISLEETQFVEKELNRWETEATNDENLR